MVEEWIIEAKKMSSIAQKQLDANIISKDEYNEIVFLILDRLEQFKISNDYKKTLNFRLNSPIENINLYDLINTLLISTN